LLIVESPAAQKLVGELINWLIVESPAALDSQTAYHKVIRCTHKGLNQHKTLEPALTACCDADFKSHVVEAEALQIGEAGQ
jgi:hypothetical protein